MGLSHNSVENYYKLNFSLIQFHKYSIHDVENLIPFEREIYSAMLLRHLEEQEQKLEEAKKKRAR